ncbi:MAG: DciA family protein [Ehrlichia sp.]
MLFRSGPKSIGSAVEGLILKKCQKSHVSKIEIRLFLNWNNIVEEEIAKVTKPKRLLFLNDTNTGILYVAVNSGGMAVNIQYAIPIIIEKISMFFGFKAVHAIKIQQRL